MNHPIADIIGDYPAFVAQRRDRLTTRGIDVTSYPLSHLAFRVPEWDQYVLKKEYERLKSLVEIEVVAPESIAGV